MIADAYYALKPWIPRRVQIALRRGLAAWLYRRHKRDWPICESAALPPPAWSGWPDGKRFAVVLTHDVESVSGVLKCEALAGLERDRGFRSAFGFVPQLYSTPHELRERLAVHGFEIMVHDVYHDGKLYRSRRTFGERCPSIQQALRDWNTRGFSSGAMHHHLPWISELNIDYDVSTYDVDPFEPQRCGVGRIFPFWVGLPGERGYVELPYTLPQDFTLFVLMREQNTAIWRQKLDWIASRGGMALIKTHPDYMEFSKSGAHPDCYPVQRYIEFLDYLKSQYEREAWFALPRDVARFWRGLPGSGSHSSIASSGSLCPSCRAALAGGWLQDYQLQQSESPRPLPSNTSPNSAATARESA
jgi:hypothetical protein